MEHQTESLSDYLDGQLTGGRKAEVERHVATCAECRARLDELRAVSRLVAGLPSHPLPAGFMQRLERRRRQSPAAFEGPAWFPPPTRLAAFALSSLIVTFVIYDQVRVMFPGSPGVSAEDAGRLPSPRLSTAEVDQARSLKPSRQLARAKGEAFDAGAARPEEAKGQAFGGLSNEALQQDLEKQKKNMGIRRIMPPESMEERAWKRLRESAPSESLNAAASPPALARGAAAPQLLKDDKERAAIEGKPFAEQAASAADKAPAADASPAPAALPPQAADGLVLGSEEERKAAWAQRGLHLNPPTVNYARNALVLVVAPDMKTAVEILGVDTRADKVVVRYRLFPRIENLAGAAARAGNPVLSYQFRVVPKTGKPLVLDRVE